MKDPKVERTVYAESDSGVSRNVVIVNGEIIRTSRWTEYCSGYRISKEHPDFIDECKLSIRYIADISPRKLKDIYHALSEGPMKDFCREVQIEKIAELQF